MLEAPALALSRSRAQDVLRWVKEAIQGHGMAQKEDRLNLVSHLRLEKMPGDIRLGHDVLCGSVEEAKNHVAQRVAIGLNDLCYGLRERGADPTFGVRVLGTSDLREDFGADWNPTMGRYCIWIEWLGLVPPTWPHKITPEDLPGAAKDDDKGYIRDYRNQNPEGWDEAMKVLHGGKALDVAAREAANGPKLPDPRRTA